MGSTWLRLTLVDEVVLSQRGATAGAHESLDYIPGATLLGAAARDYSKFDRAEALAIFHGGAVRFGNATLEVDGEPGLPMPFAWHARKRGPEGILNARILAGNVANYQHTTFEALEGVTTPVQPKQLRSGYVSRCGTVSSPERRYRTKTAIEPGQRFAAEAQLFSYESLAPLAGQHFLAPLQWDDGLSQRALDQIRRIFSGTTLHIGRSRSAEYGTVRVEWLARPVEDAADEAEGCTDEITLWLLSDLAAEDARGMPTLMPAPQDLGLPAGTLDLSRSFLRGRRYSPFNAHDRAFERERVVLSQGSVLHYVLNERGTWTQQHSARAAAGLGLYRECGLGRVAVNHPLLAGPHPTFDERTLAAAPPPPRAAAQHPVVQWLRARTSSAEASEAAQRAALRLAEEYMTLLPVACRYHGLEPGTAVGPSPSQWAAVAQEARKYATASPRLYGALFGEDGLCGRERSGWGLEIRPGQTFADWLREQCARGEQPQVEDPLRLQYLAHEIRARLQRERQGS
jgi:hypothetical protein